MGKGTPEYKLGYIHDRQTIAILGGIWHDVRMYYDESGNMVYRAVHEIMNSSEDDTDWEIWKYTWDENSNCSRIQGPIKGSCTGRASLEWS